MSVPSNKRYVLLVASLSSSLAAFMSSAINIALPTIGREFGVDAVAIAWVTTAYLLSVAACLLPFGRLADLYGRRRSFTLGVAVYSFASLFCALAPSNAILIGFRVLQGVGGAMIFSTSTALVASAFPPKDRGHALGWNTAAVYTGLSLGPFLGGILTQHLGWRSLFLANLPLGAFVLVVVLWKIRGEWTEFRGARFDRFGAAIYVVGIVALMIGFSALPAPTGLLLVLSGLFGLVAFGLWEQRTSSPLLDLRLFRANRTLTLSNLAALINYAATAAVGFLLSLYLQYNRVLSPDAAGLVLVAQPVLQTLFSPLAGRLSDRVQPRFLASAGMAMTVLGLALLTRLHPGTPLLLIVATLAWLGLSFALFSAPNTNAVMGAVDRRFYGVASGSLATMRALGQMASMGVATVFLSLYVGRVPITQANATQFLTCARATFAVFAGLCFLGLLASLARGNLPEPADRS